MDSQRFGHSATLLTDGTVLIAGGLSGPDSDTATVDLAEVYDPSTNQFSARAAMIQPRQSHTATTLNNGKVLITGGDNGRDALESAELFDPATGLFDPLATVMSTPRTGHTATILEGSVARGRVLIVGGSPAFDPDNGIFVGSLSSGELFDPRSGGQFEPLPVQMHFARSGPAATLLADGQVLISGGVDQQGLVQGSAELFQILNSAAVEQNPQTALKINFAPAGMMNTPRFFHASILLPDKTVLIVGGIGTSQNVLASAEIYDPAQKTFTPVGPMNEARQSPAVALVNNNSAVLIAGGSGDDSVEIYDPNSKTFSLFSASQSQRLLATATLLEPGNILIAGGFELLSTSNETDVQPTNPQAELFDPAGSTFMTAGSMVMPRAYDTATLIGSSARAGQVLIAGGKSLAPVGTILAAAQIYDPQAPTFRAPQDLNEARFLHTATRLDCSTAGCPNGNVLLAGGVGANGSLSSAELYAPATPTTTPTFSETSPLTDARDSATATAFAGGSVLIAGGEQITASSATLLDSAEIYDPNSTPPSFSCVGGTSGNPPACNSSMQVARRLHTATLLPNGAVLITGGVGTGGTGTAAAELFEPGANGGSFMTTGSMTEARVGHTATYLDPAVVTGSLAGQVLIAGGSNDLSAETYNPATGTFSPVTARMNAVHSFHTAILLQNGRVLIAGGGPGDFSDLLDGSFAAEPTAEIFDPATATFVLANNLVSARALQSATLLDPKFVSGPLAGQVLIAGGETINSVQAGAELFKPAMSVACATCSQ
jgi:hypothetical protein